MANSSKANDENWVYKEQINLNKLFATGPIVKKMMANCSINQEQINSAWKKHCKNIQLTKSWITLSLPIIGNKKLYQRIRSKYDTILADKKYVKLGILEIKEELFVLLIMSYEYYWVRDGLVLRSYVERHSPLNDNSTFKSLVNYMNDIADAISAIIAIDEALYSERYININGSFKISDETILLNLKANLNTWLSNIEPVNKQLSLNLLYAYELYKKNDDASILTEEIKKIKAIENKDFEPMLNDTIAIISLIIREFLINNGFISETKVTPKIFLQLITDLFDVVKISTTALENTDNKPEVIRLAIRYFRKKLQKSGK